MIRAVQTTFIYCFEARDEKAHMSPGYVNRCIQTSAKTWHCMDPGPGQFNCHGGKLGFCLLPVHYEQVEKTPNENY